MNAFEAFFAMGGHAAYIWPAYGIAVVVLAALVIASLRALRAREAELRTLEAESPRRRRTPDRAAAGGNADDA